MKKMRLALDALAVESFATERASAGSGTVHGRGMDASYPIACDPPSDSMDPFLDTCQYATCAGSTCWQSCNGTCNCGGGSAGCGTASAGYTYCWKDASCIEQCDPITP
jgi:hypothetical protein